MRGDALPVGARWPWINSAHSASAVIARWPEVTWERCYVEALSGAALLTVESSGEKEERAPLARDCAEQRGAGSPLSAALFLSERQEPMGTGAWAHYLR